MVPFLPMIPQSALPSLSLQLVPHIRFVPTLQGGPQAVGGIVCQIQESPPWRPEPPYHGSSSQHIWVMLCSLPLAHPG